MTILQEEQKVEAKSSPFTISLDFTPVAEPTAEGDGVFYRLPVEGRAPQAVPTYVDSNLSYFLFVHDKKLTYTVNTLHTGVNKHSKKEWKRWVRSATVTFSFKKKGKDDALKVNIYSTVKALKGRQGKIMNITPSVDRILHTIKSEHLPFIVEKFNEKYTELIGELPEPAVNKVLHENKIDASWFQRVIYPGAQDFDLKNIPPYLTKKMKEEDTEVYKSIFGKYDPEFVALLVNQPKRLRWVFVFAKLVPFENLKEFLENPKYVYNDEFIWDYHNYRVFRKTLRKLNMETRLNLLYAMNNDVLPSNVFNDLYPFKASNVFDIKKLDVTGPNAAEIIGRIESTAEILVETSHVQLNRIPRDLLVKDLDKIFTGEHLKKKYNTSYALSRYFKLDLQANSTFRLTNARVSGKGFSHDDELKHFYEIFIQNTEAWNRKTNIYTPQQYRALFNAITRYCVKALNTHKVPVTNNNIQKLVALVMAYMDEPKISMDEKEVSYQPFPEIFYDLLKVDASVYKILLFWAEGFKTLDEGKDFLEAPLEWLEMLASPEVLNITSYYKPEVSRGALINPSF